MGRYNPEKEAAVAAMEGAKYEHVQRAYMGEGLDMKRVQHDLHGESTGEITELIGLLDRQISKNLELVSSLISKIDPVLAHNPRPPGDKPEPDDRPSTEIGQKLHSLSIELEVMHMRIKNAVDEVSL